MDLSVVHQERLLVHQAQSAIQEAIRDWHPTYKVLGRRDPVNGNVVATLLAWSEMSNGLATRLDILGANVDVGFILHIQVLPEARAYIRRVSLDLWPSAMYMPNPFTAALPAPVEFANYRYGAAMLAQRLALISARCWPHYASYQPAIMEHPTGERRSVQLGSADGTSEGNR